MDNPYPICENCIFVDEPLDKDPCQECNRAFLARRIKPNFVSKRKPKTNADRIRSMTDEELAKFMGELPCCPPGADLKELCYPMDSCEGTDLQVQCWLEWLRQEAGDVQWP